MGAKVAGKAAEVAESEREIVEWRFRHRLVPKPWKLRREIGVLEKRWQRQYRKLAKLELQRVQADQLVQQIRREQATEPTDAEKEVERLAGELQANCKALAAEGALDELYAHPSQMGIFKYLFGPDLEKVYKATLAQIGNIGRLTGRGNTRTDRLLVEDDFRTLLEWAREAAPAPQMDDSADGAADSPEEMIVDAEDETDAQGAEDEEPLQVEGSGAEGDGNEEEPEPVAVDRAR